MKFFLILSICLNFFATAIFAQWFHQTPPVIVNYNSVTAHHGTNDIAWVCGDSGVILYTSNSGANWILQNSGTTKNLYTIVFMEAVGGPVICMGEDGIILYSNAANPQWVQLPSPVTQTIRSLSDFGFLAVGDSGVIIKSTDTGQSWFQVQSPVTKDLRAVQGTFTLHAVGDDGTFLRALHPGLVWEQFPTPFTNRLNGVPMFSSANLIVGDNGLILRSTTAGASWYTQNSHTTKNLKATQFSVNNTSRIYIVGDSGVILRSTDWGDNFGFQHSGSTENLNSVFFYLDDNTGFAVGNNGTILKTTNAGGFTTLLEPVAGTGSPVVYTLEQNYPNPFNPNTIITFQLPVSSFVTLKVFDITGKEISTLVNDFIQIGKYSLEFKSQDLPSGVYFYTLTASEFRQTKRMLLVK